MQQSRGVAGRQKQRNERKRKEMVKEKQQMDEKMTCSGLIKYIILVFNKCELSEMKHFSHRWKIKWQNDFKSSQIKCSLCNCGWTPI